MNKPMVYKGLVKEIGELLQSVRENTGRTINTILINTYRQIGKHIVEFEQGGKENATNEKYALSSYCVKQGKLLTDDADKL